MDLFLVNTLQIDAVICYIFAAMELIKIMAWGGLLRYFILMYSNRFDLLITITTLILALSGYNTWIQLSQFRILRLLHMVLSIKYLSRLRRILTVAMGKPGTVGASVTVIASTIVLFAVIGRQVFHGVVWKHRGEPIHYFDTFWESLITVTEVVTKERVQTLISEGSHQVGATTLIFVILATILIDCIVLRIVTAMILYNFVSSDSERIRFQLQFERLSILKGWSEEDRNKEWDSGSTRHIALVKVPHFQ